MECGYVIMLIQNLLKFMKRSKFTVRLRNDLSNIAMSFDSAFCINDGGLRNFEREHLQEKIRDIVKEIDKEISEEK